LVRLRKNKILQHLCHVKGNASFFTKYCDLNVHRQAWLWKKVPDSLLLFFARAGLPILPQRHHHAHNLVHKQLLGFAFLPPVFRVEIPIMRSGYRNGDGRRKHLAKNVARSPSMIVRGLQQSRCESGGPSITGQGPQLPQAYCPHRVETGLFCPWERPARSGHVPEAPRSPRSGEAGVHWQPQWGLRRDE